MVRNVVEVEVEQDGQYSYAVITKEDCYSVIVINCENTIVVYGGGYFSIPKSMNTYHSSEEAYVAFCRKVGKLCKKPADKKGHYFSEVETMGDGTAWVEDEIPEAFSSIKDKVIDRHFTCSDYEDMVLICRDIEIGSVIFKYDVETNSTERGNIIHVIKRSDNAAWYDEHDLDQYEEELNDPNYAFSGEFILDDDCYYVFAK